MNTKNKKGFTLIELLVVIAIIGLLASIVLVSLNSARGKARDARRLSDLRQIMTALELSYDKNGYLPVTSSYGENNSGGWDYSSQGDFLTFLRTAGIVGAAPKDLVNNGAGDVYYGGTGFSYAYYCYPGENSLSLGAKMEDGSVSWTASHKTGYVCQ